MKRKGRLCALVLAMAFACTGFSACGNGGGESSAPAPDSSSSAPESSGTGASDEALSIHYLTARGANEGTIQALQKIADEYQETHPNFNYEVEIISDRSSYLQKLRILASSDELPEWFDSDADSFYAELVGKRLPISALCTMSWALPMTFTPSPRTISVSRTASWD